MEINNMGLGAIYMDNLRMSATRDAQNPQHNFDEILRKAGASSADRSGAVLRPMEAPIDKEDELFKLCMELETFIAKNLLTGMRSTVQKSGLVDDSFAGKIYEDMLYDEYAKDFTKNAGFGLAEQAYRQLKNYY
ncbi:MAG: rod-binding protein [Bacteroidales bacterium]|jgi:flagellar protein FlgJ|nr:rod-binding protein [Bacteroidales bacterium]